MSRAIVLALSCALLVPASPARAAWSTDPAVNTPLCTAMGDQYLPVLVPDGTGGAIAVWTDHRFGIESDLFAQRIDGSGVTGWSYNGLAIAPAYGAQSEVVAASDGAGGVIAAWNNRSDGGADIYAQRVTSAGAGAWPYSGVYVRTGRSANPIDPPRIVADGSGGAIIAWRDGATSGNSPGIMAQRLTAAGAPVWGANGKVVCSAGASVDWPALVSDGAGGAIIAWVDSRGGSGSWIFAQRIGAAGNAMWTANGVPVCATGGEQFMPDLAAAGGGGAIVAWVDERRADGGDIFAQRLSGAGALMWDAAGIAVCTAAGSQGVPQLVPDGAGGAAMAWADGSNGVGFSFYAQRLDAAGAPLWAAGGVPLCTIAGSIWSNFDPRLLRPFVATDGAGGLIAAWWDMRLGQQDIYAQRIDAAGVARWLPEGAPVCTQGTQQYCSTVVSDGAGGAVIAWCDVRNGSWDIYAQRLNALGHLGDASLAVPADAATRARLEPPHPNPAHGAAAIGFELPRAGHASLAVFDAQGRRVRSLLEGAQPAGRGAVRWDGADDAGRPLGAGLYFARLVTDGEVLETRIVWLP
jgi:hypothetical protein